VFINQQDVCERIDHLVRDWVCPARIAARQSVDIARWEAPGEPVAFDDAIAHHFEPASVGQPWSFPWGTAWFHVVGMVPKTWASAPHADQRRTELVIDLGFGGGGPGFQAEGTVYRPDGTVVKGIEPRNLHIPVEAGPGEDVEFYIEAASNPNISSAGWTTPTPLGSKETAGSAPLYHLKTVELRHIDTCVEALLLDVTVLRGWVDVLADKTARKADIIHALCGAIDALDPEHVSDSAAAAREALRPALSSPATASATQVYAVGHAHIDSAWLWPLRETRRKVARTFSNVLYLMDVDPDFTFAASSAQQYQWLLEDHPDLFRRIQRRVAEGRWIIVGGEWVEADANMIGGEAFIRQFSEGMAFFRQHFDIDPDIVWLPDSFGYSAALPGIARHVGMQWMLTQKLSWNDTNTFPHTSFWWEGIDGNRIFTHFPPADTYGATFAPSELARGESHFKELGAAKSTMLLYGYGDGGGGPTREMLELARRQENLEGSPRIKLASPDEFFEHACDEYPQAPTWSGELYLENHRGVLTSQHRMKAGNRRSEHLLREAEMWAATAAVRMGVPYPYRELHEIWRIALLLQFHDILPGSAIEWVYQDATKMYADIERRVRRIIDASVSALVGDGERELAANPGAYAVCGVVAGAIAEPRSEGAGTVAIHKDGDGHGWILDNTVVRLHLNDRGMIDSLIDLADRRQLVPSNEQLGRLVISRDIPNHWDAWNIDDDYRRHEKTIEDCDDIRVSNDDAGAAVIVITRHEGASSFVQTIRLASHTSHIAFTTDVDWHEKHKLLKLAFPLDMMTDYAQSEIQFGHLTRPIHTNTSWEHAKFETVAQRWVRVEEGDFGVAIANDQTYGHGIVRARGPEGPYVIVGESLLRGPEAPDPHADQGEFAMSTVLVVGASLDDAIEEGYRLNAPIRRVRGRDAVEPLVSLAAGNGVIEALKLADDESGDVIVRLYESHGGRTTVRLVLDPAFTQAVTTDALERASRADGGVSTTLVPDATHGIEVELTPFQICTLRLKKEVS
jgi:alpha-mannosidase